MHVFINEREIPTGAAAGATIGEVVEASRLHVDPSEIVTAVALDGVAFNAGEEERYGRRSAASVQRLDISTRTPTAFAAEKRHSLAETLDEVAERTRLVVGLLQRSETRAANGLLACLMEELRLTLVLDYQLTLLAEDAPSGAREAIAELAPALLEAEERRAWDVLAGLLDTKLVPTLQWWAGTTRARVAEGAGATQS
jgi:hypothetical protein